MEIKHTSWSKIDLLLPLQVPTSFASTGDFPLPKPICLLLPCLVRQVLKIQCNMQLKLLSVLTPTNPLPTGLDVEGVDPSACDSP